MSSQISIHALLAESDSHEQKTKGRHSAFLSTLSLRRATISCAWSASKLGDFYPRSPCGERRTTTITICIALKFLSTLSLRRATYVLVNTFSKIFNFYPRSPCGERQQKCTKQWGTFAHMKQILWRLHLHADRQGCILPFLPCFFHIFWCEGTGNFMIAFPSH